MSDQTAMVTELWTGSDDLKVGIAPSDSLLGELIRQFFWRFRPYAQPCWDRVFPNDPGIFISHGKYGLELRFQDPHERTWVTISAGHVETIFVTHPHNGKWFLKVVPAENGKGIELATSTVAGDMVPAHFVRNAFAWLNRAEELVRLPVSTPVPQPLAAEVALLQAAMPELSRHAAGVTDILAPGGPGLCYWTGGASGVYHLKGSGLPQLIIDTTTHGGLRELKTSGGAEVAIWGDNNRPEMKVRGRLTLAEWRIWLNAILSQIPIYKGLTLSESPLLTHVVQVLKRIEQALASLAMPDRDMRVRSGWPVVPVIVGQAERTLVHLEVKAPSPYPSVALWREGGTQQVTFPGSGFKMVLEDGVITNVWSLGEASIGECIAALITNLAFLFSFA